MIFGNTKQLENEMKEKDEFISQLQADIQVLSSENADLRIEQKKANNIVIMNELIHSLTAGSTGACDSNLGMLRDDLEENLTLLEAVDENDDTLYWYLETNAGFLMIGEMNGLLNGLQDLGGGGLCCAAVEMSEKGGTGLLLDLNNVPVKAENMEGWEILISESQERMLAVSALSQAISSLCRMAVKYAYSSVVNGEA